MKNKICFTLIVAAVLSVGNVFAQLGDEQKEFTRADTLRGNLSEERLCFDVTYYHLNAKINPDEKSIQGSNQIRFKVIKNTKRIQVDLFENLKVDRIIFNDQEVKFKREYGAVFIDFPIELKAGTMQNIYIDYSGKPQVAKNAPWDGGISYARDSAGNDWVAVSCQGTGASCWWPCKDHQSDEPDSMLISISCPSKLMDVSNGRLRKTTDLKDGYTRYDWFVANPINTYNVTFNIGVYEHFGDTLGTLTLDYYVLPENLEKAKIQFQQVKPMLICFENYFGKYPWYEDGYKLVETPYLGMEHQSAVAYGNKYENGYLGRSLSSSGIGKKFDYIIIHESAHEWWGNNVTTKDIADMWVHEGFAVYAEALYVECIWGKEDYTRYLNGKKFNISNKTTVIGAYNLNSEGSGDMYDKGAMLLHTLRSMFDNDTRFFAVIKGIQKEFYHQTVTTEQIENSFSKAYGKSLDPVFDQYLRYIVPPKILFKTTASGIEYKWQADVKGFNMPLKIVNADKTYSTLYPTQEWQKLSGYSSVENIKVASDLYYVKIGKD